MVIHSSLHGMWHCPNFPSQSPLFETYRKWLPLINCVTIVDVSGTILGRGPLFCQFSYKATTSCKHPLNLHILGGYLREFDCIYNVYFITFRQNERSSKVFVKNMCSQGKKSLEMELTLIILIDLTACL